MKNLRNALVLLGLVSMFGVSAAQAGKAGISLFGVGVLPQSIGDAAVARVTGKLGFGGGATVGYRLGSRVSIETGGAYVMRKYGVEVGGVDLGLDTTSGSVYIPLGLRFHFNRVLSLQAGGFYDISTESGGGSNYGVQGGLRLSAPISQGAALFLDGRYNLGLKDFSGTKASDLVLGMVGITFGGGAGK